MKAVILAAGRSSRFKPLSDNQHKGLTEVLGKPIIEHTADELRDAGVDEIIVVQGPDREIEKQAKHIADHFVVQEEPEGMGNALRQAQHLLKGRFMVLTPYRANAAKFFKPMIQKAEDENSEIVFVSTPTQDPEKYGILELEDGKATDMVEKPEPSQAPSDQKIVGMYLLHESFFDYLDEVEKWEYQYEDALSEQMRETPASVLKIQEETNSIKYPWDLFSVTEELLETREKQVADTAEIADSAEIKGKVIVEENAKIFENAVVKGPAYIGKNAVVGNNALIRENSCLEKNVAVGTNSEVKNTLLQPGSSFHSGFLGDSVIGRDSKIGAGTITANRKFRENGERPQIASELIAKEYSEDTCRRSLGAFIGEDVDIGVNVSLMPGVQIGSNARIGPGTVVTENVENGKTVYVDQEVKTK
ncbi:bifunctional sugar-1-phosphate nucleotidylyltransferase/acetyltransferase [Candidatus Nanohalococcus occultus]|uniref:Bifunctional UDP-N-acetylglucosamine pyrophosphorylase / Glucosamine-1-phosphate N-acetyltransferase n=1 Tax=Candidatus Nanohalococcus occultus TaxID=2978047 RepID=A0ABY8CED5_9ARCH|nr:bifunctional UDP-N-acetylglucosamine pyrophosphorylase / Glucosamine-1-phosphate N-acetyltransferase [Candidatus Nanohaloarchaeota archaeon SVXNc]